MVRSQDAKKDFGDRVTLTEVPHDVDAGVKDLSEADKERMPAFKRDDGAVVGSQEGVVGQRILRCSFPGLSVLSACKGTAVAVHVVWNPPGCGVPVSGMLDDGDDVYFAVPNAATDAQVVVDAEFLSAASSAIAEAEKTEPWLETAKLGLEGATVVFKYDVTGKLVITSIDSVCPLGASHTLRLESPDRIVFRGAFLQGEEQVTFSGLRPGRYTLYVSCFAECLPTKDLRTVTVTACTVTQVDLKAHAVPGEPFIGRVYRQDGAVQGATARVVRRDCGADCAPQVAMTDADGYFTATVDRGGVYEVWIEPKPDDYNLVYGYQLGGGPTNWSGEFHVPSAEISVEVDAEFGEEVAVRLMPLLFTSRVILQSSVRARLLNGIPVLFSGIPPGRYFITGDVAPDTDGLLRSMSAVVDVPYRDEAEEAFLKVVLPSRRMGRAIVVAFDSAGEVVRGVHVYSKPPHTPAVPWERAVSMQPSAVGEFAAVTGDDVIVTADYGARIALGAERLIATEVSRSEARLRVGAGAHVHVAALGSLSGALLDGWWWIEDEGGGNWSLPVMHQVVSGWRFGPLPAGKYLFTFRAAGGHGDRRWLSVDTGTQNSIVWTVDETF